MPDQNELYAQWRDASGAEKADLEEKLFRSVQRYARAVVFIRLGEGNPELADDIAWDAIRGLGNFRGESKFTTWVGGIAKNKVADEIEARERDRERPYLDIDIRTDLEDDWAGHFDPALYTTFEERSLLLRELSEGLDPEDSILFRGMVEGKDQNELAHELGISTEALQTRRIRLRKKLLRKLARP